MIRAVGRSTTGAVYCGTVVREDDGWELFAKLERYHAGELYPHHRSHPTWK